MDWTSILKLSKGKDWEIFFLKRDLPDEWRKQVNDLGWNQEEVEWGITNFNAHYEKVASIQFHNNTMGGQHLFRLTNSVDESWYEEFDGEHDDWTMQVHKKGGVRSSMVGDIFFDKDNNEHWMIAAVGFKKVRIDYSEGQ